MDMDMGIRMLNEMMGALFGKSQLASDDIGNLKRTMIKRVLSEDIEAHDYTRRIIVYAIEPVTGKWAGL